MKFSIESIISWFKRNWNEIKVGVLSGVIASIIFALLVKTSQLKEWFFDLPSEPKCSSTKMPSDNLFIYNWNITVNVKNRNKVLIYNNSDFFIQKGSLVKNELIYHTSKVNEYSSGDYLGLIVHFEKPKDEWINIAFTTESTKPMESDSCQNFFLSL